MGPKIPSFNTNITKLQIADPTIPIFIHIFISVTHPLLFFYPCRAYMRLSRRRTPEWEDRLELPFRNPLSLPNRTNLRIPNIPKPHWTESQVRLRVSVCVYQGFSDTHHSRLCIVRRGTSLSIGIPCWLGFPQPSSDFTCWGILVRHEIDWFWHTKTPPKKVRVSAT